MRCRWCVRGWCSALRRFRENFVQLPERVQSRLTLENDDVSYTVDDLIPLCKDMHIPLVYDVHHHRCLPDGRSVEETTELTLKTWNREPLFHISSARDKNHPQYHADYINVEDFPDCWNTNQTITVEIEAKAKELAIKNLVLL